LNTLTPCNSKDGVNGTDWKHGKPPNKLLPNNESWLISLTTSLEVNLFCLKALA